MASLHRRIGLTKMAGVVLGLGAASGLIWQSSNAALTASTDNGVNSWEAGTVTLVDDDSGSLMFNATNMVPGDSVTHCIEVDYTGSSYDLNPVKLYSSIATDVDTFASHLDVTIEEGSGADFTDCSSFTGSSLYSGTLANLAATHSDYSNGVSGFTPASGSTARAYKFVVTLGSDTPNTAQGDSASATFTWEVQSA